MLGSHPASVSFPEKCHIIESMVRQSLVWSAGGLVARPTVTPTPTALRAVQWVPVLVWLSFPVTLALAITRQSLWIDEGFTVWFASHSDFHSFLKALVGSRGAPGDPQFIFYLLHMWGWIKLFGGSELSLRAANIPFAVIFVYTMSWASRRLFWNDHLWALFCLSPFFWFYLNEARPYVALLAFSSVASVALLAYLVDPDLYGRRAPWYCLIALFLGWGMNILALFLFPVLLILVASTLGGKRELRLRFFRDWSRPFLCCLPGFLALATFYGCVSTMGVNKCEGKPGLANLAFALYEFTGFAGLGPPRNEIRETQSLSVFLPYWPWLLVAAIVLLAVVWSVFRRTPPKITRNLAASVASGFAFALIVSRFEHFQVLGRHLAVLFPPLLMILMLAPQSSPFKQRACRVVVASLASLAVVWGISDVRLVFISKYKKDSYREACAIALAKAREQGALIVWAADPVTAKYYGLIVGTANSSDSGSGPGNDKPAPFRAVQGDAWSFDEAAAHIATSPTPTILVLSRPWSFDPQGTWSTLLREAPPAEIARLNALSIFEWQPKEAHALQPADRLCRLPATCSSTMHGTIAFLRPARRLALDPPGSRSYPKSL